jgi:hypothetical protein
MRARRRTWAVLGPLALLGVVSPTPARAGDEFGPAQARALIPEAAGVSLERFSTLKQLGPFVREDDLRQGGSTPLTLAVLGYRPWQPTGDAATDRERARDFRCPLGTGATLTDFSFAIGAGPPKPARAFVSLLLPECIRDVTCERNGTKARGQVTYRSTESLIKEPLYEGVILWAATQGPKGWAIDEFRMPGCRFGVRLVGGAWEPFDEERPGLPVRIRTAALLATPPAVLPVVESAASRSTVPRAIEYALAADGALFDATDEAMDFESIARDLLTQFVLRGVSGRDGGVAIAGDVILRVAHHAPWDAAAWVLEALADPRVEADRLHFAVQPEKGGEDGVLPSFLPKDGGARSTLVLRLAPHARSVAPAAGRAFLDERLAKAPGSRVVIRADAGLAAGHVIRVVDWSRRAGAKEVAFAKPAAQRPTGRPGVPEAGPRRWRTPIMTHVAEHPIREWGFSLASGDATLVGDEAPLAPPSAPPAEKPK